VGFEGFIGCGCFRGWFGFFMGGFTVFGFWVSCGFWVFWFLWVFRVLFCGLAGFLCIFPVYLGALYAF
jgi:hypothetical protein